jgi:glycosyltransferase involved in cell wall biosynthesis
MLTTSDNAVETGSAAEREALEYHNGAMPASARPHTNGTADHKNRLGTMFPAEPTVNGEAGHPDKQPVLVVFCYEPPGSIVGQFVTNLVAPLARKQISVHVFSPKDFELDAPGVSMHVLGESDGELLDQVQEFTRRACNAFLQAFPNGSDSLTLLGLEWSAVDALSLLHGIKNVPALLSLHSLERQRSDLSSDLSRRIEEAELEGLRQAKTVLLHDAATAELARSCVPECAERVVLARQPFPLEQFNRKIDPGEVKARYQVGPVDPAILYIGDLDERYGPDLLVKALPVVLKNHRQARLIVVGDGNLYWPLRVYTRYLLLEHAVRLVGSLEGQPLQELIQAADVIAVPSREATPWWPVQAAWAARRPVVATHNAAVGLLEHEKDSVLFYPSENSCVWGIERVLFDAELAKNMGERGQQKLEERFGWSSVAAQVVELMEIPQSVSV